MQKHVCFAVCLNNYHEHLRARPSSWMVAGSLPSLDKDVTNNWDKEGGNSNVVQNIEVFLQYFDAMFTGWNEFSEEPRLMEWANGETAMTHTLFAGVIVDKEEEGKIMATGQGCNTCPCPKADYLNPGKVYPPKSSSDILNAVLKVACDPLQGMSPGHLIGRDAAGHREQKGTQGAGNGCRVWYTCPWTMDWSEYE